MRNCRARLPIVALSLLILTPFGCCGEGDKGPAPPNLFSGVAPALSGTAQELKEGYCLLPGGKFSLAKTARIGQGLTRYNVKTAVQVKGDGIARITLAISGQKDQAVTVTLTPQWLTHALAWPPAGSQAIPLAGVDDTVSLRVEVLGNNVAFVRDAHLEITEPAAKKPAAEDEEGALAELTGERKEPPKPEAKAAEPAQKALPVPPGMVNIVSLATVRISPFGSLVYRLRDGDDGTGIVPESIGDERCGAFEFIFDKPQSIAFMRFFQAARRYALFADENGDGEYEHLLANVSDHPTSWYDTDWITHSFNPPVKARAVKLVNLTDNMPLMEMEIYVPADGAPAVPAAPALEPGVAELQEIGEVQVAPAGEPYIKGVVVEPWMFPWHGWRTDKEQRALLQYPPFKKFVEDLKDWGTNMVEIFPPTTFIGPEVAPAGLSPDVNAYLWPSKYYSKCIKENDLTKICDAFHAMGMKVLVMQRPPYWAGWKEDERDKEKDFKKRYAWEVERWAGINLEIVESGADGASLCFDEQYAGGMPDSLEFEQRFGCKPGQRGDTEAARKWRVFTYEAWGVFMRDSIALMRQKSPRPFTAFTRVSAYEAYTNNRPQLGTCYDILCRTVPDLDYFGTDPYHTQEDANIGHYNCAAYTKRMKATARNGKFIVTLNAPWTEDPKWFTRFPPVSVYGPALSSAMHSGGDCTYYRYNYFRDRQDYHLHVKTAFGMLDTIAAWGGKQAVVPRKIAVLKSRASEDWWYWKIIHGPPGNQTEAARSFFAEKAVLEMLLANGYPFVMYYLDITDDLKNLVDFKLILIPSAYSVPREALPHLEKAAQAGARILVFEKQGETDEWGTPYPEPLLQAPAKAGMVELLNEDLSRCGYDPAFHQRMCERFDKVLGADKSLYLNRYGKDVEAACLEKANGDRLLFATNWTKKPVTIDLGVSIPPGSYEMLKRDLARTTRVAVGGKDKLSEQDVRKFRVGLKPGEANVFLIRKLP